MAGVAVPGPLLSSCLLRGNVVRSRLLLFSFPH